MSPCLLAAFDLSALTPAWVIAPIAAILALIIAFIFSRTVLKHSEGDARMIEIADAVRTGARAYLIRQYRVVAIFFIAIVAVLLLLGWLGAQDTWSAAGVPIAGFLSGLCGWLGMKMATQAGSRTANAARDSLNKALIIAFRSGAVMGLIVVGFALLDLSVWFYLWNTFLPARPVADITALMLTFGLGASTQALFARVGGGIFTKAADVGADLVGKIESGIPEDDPRNPAVIADNVGDNVGDVAGMGADLYESYYGSILAAMALGAAAAMGLATSDVGEALGLKLAAAPLALAGLGIIGSLIGMLVVRTHEGATFKQLLNTLRRGVIASSLVIAVAAFGLFWWMFNDTPEVSWLGFSGAIITGLAAGLLIAFATEYSTSYDHPPTQSIAEQAQTGPATVIISGIAVGLRSTWIPFLVVVVAILAAFRLGGGNESYLLGLYGVAIAAVGMLSTLGITLATDAYGPIADNAGGNAQMAGLPALVRERTDMLDSLGNTTAATGKGFAIGSAALTALALLAAYVSVVQSELSRHLTPNPDTVARLVAAATSATPVALQAESGQIHDDHGHDHDDHHHAHDHHEHAHDDHPHDGHDHAHDDQSHRAHDHAHHDHDHSHAGPRTLIAEYRGHGRFAVVFTDSHDHPFGAVMLASNEAARHVNAAHHPGDIMVFRDASNLTDPAVYRVSSEFSHGDHKDFFHFDLLDIRAASMPQLLKALDVTLMNPNVLGGMLIGVMLTFLFCALTMNAVGRAAFEMMNECRRQFAAIRAHLRSRGMSESDAADAAHWPASIQIDGAILPDHARCVAISTARAQREMILPSCLAIITPLIVGLALGVGGVMGLLVGGLASGFAMAVFMANAGGAWDNAKKFIEKGRYGGKGSIAHKAAVVGDTVGDPFKDTSGPSLNILIKLIAIVSIVFAGLVVRFGPVVAGWLGLS
jgi:H(+)-translocating pyrophosphatase